MNDEISAGDETVVDASQTRLLRQVSRGGAWGALSFGALGIAVWIVGAPALNRLAPGYVSPSPPSAVCILLLGVALQCALKTPGSHRRFLCSGVLLPVVGLVSLSLSGIHFAAQTALTEHLGVLAGDSYFPLLAQMSPISAICFLLLGIGIWTLVDGRSPVEGALSALLGSGVCGGSLVIVLGYCHGTPLFGGLARPVSLITAVSNLALGLALVTAAGPRHFPLSVFAGPSIRARLLRVFVPAIFLAVFVNDLVSRHILPNTLNPALANAIHALVSLVIVSILVSSVARWVGNARDDAEASRRKAEEALRDARDKLELRVQERATTLESANAALRVSEQTVRESEARLRMALEVAGMVTWEWDIPSGIIRYSDNLPAVVRGEAVSPYCTLEGVMQMLHPEDRQRLAQALERTRAEGSPFECEYRPRMVDGTYRWILGKGRIVVTEAGKAVRVQGVSQDITTRKQAEEEIRRLNDTLEARIRERTAELETANAELPQSEEQFRNLAEQSPNMVFINGGGRVVYANLLCSQIMGYSRETLLSAEFNFLTLIAPDSIASVRDSFQRHQRGEEVASYECALMTRAGQRLDTVINTRLISYHGQRAILGIVTDISERKQVEAAVRQLNETLEQRVRERTAQLEAANQALRVNEERLALAQEAGHIGTWDWNLVTNKTVWTRETEALFGLPPGAFGDSTNQRWEQFLHPDDRPRVLALVKESIARRAGAQAEFRIIRPDGSICWIADSWKVICNDRGESVRVVGVNRDITEHKRTEEQLHVFSRAVEQSSVAVIITDPQGNIEHVNAKFSQVTGYSLDEVRGQNPRLLKSGETPPEEYARLWQTITVGHEWHGLFHNKRKNGELFWESAFISPLLDETGRITHFVAIKEDITNQRRVAECNTALGRLGHQLSAASTPVEAGRIILDVASELLGWDAAFLHLISSEGELDPVITFDICEGRREEFPATSLESLKPSWMMLEVIRSGGRLVEGPGEPQPSLPLVAFGNTGRRSASRLFVPIYQGPRAVGVMSIQSYTPRKYTEESLRLLQSLADHCAGALERIRSAAALHEEERNHRALLDAIPDALLRLRADGTVLDARTGDLAFLDRPAEAAGHNLSDLMDPRIAKDILHHARQCLEARAGTVFSTALHRAGTEPAIVDIRVVPGGSGEVVVMLRDITVIRQTEQAVIEAVAREQRRIGRELHDGLGQELAGIAVKAKILEEDLQVTAAPAAAEAAELVRRVNSSIRLTRQLARGLEPVEVELGNLVLALERFVAESEATYRVRCAFECSLAALHLPPATGIHLYRIVQEAVRNAAQHGHPKFLRIELHLEGPHLVLTVRDDGQGFNPATGDQQGLGLRIMRYRANLIGAVLTFESSPGQGTEVRCVIRECPSGPSPPAPGDRSPAP